jgi:drug/metabolite transporter (DMT)-like permease
MRASEAAGAGYGALGMTAVGGSLAVSTALVGYPVAPAQAVRYLVAAGLLALVARARRLPVPRPTAREYGRLALLAATGMAGFNACVVLALRSAEPAAVGVVVGAAPLLIAVVAPLVAGRAPRPAVLAAAALVVAGIALVEGGGRTSPAGTLFAAGALVGEVAFTLLAAPLLPRLGPVGVSLHACLLAGGMLAAGAPVVAAVAGTAVLPRPTAAVVAAAGYLALAVTAFAFLAWYTCVGRLGAERAGLLIGLMPVAALAAGVALGQTAPTPLAVTGVGLVGLGVATGLARPPAAGTPGARPAGSPAGRPDASGSSRPVTPGPDTIRTVDDLRRTGRLLSGA